MSYILYTKNFLFEGQYEIQNLITYSLKHILHPWSCFEKHQAQLRLLFQLRLQFKLVKLRFLNFHILIKVILGLHSTDFTWNPNNRRFRTLLVSSSIQRLSDINTMRLISQGYRSVCNYSSITKPYDDHWTEFQDYVCLSKSKCEPHYLYLTSPSDNLYLFELFIWRWLKWALDH